MKTLQEQYNAICEGKGHKGTFLKEAKKQFPNMITNAATIEETVQILTNRSVISENLGGYVDLKPVTKWEGRAKEGYEIAYAKFLAEEAKVVEKDTTKEVDEAKTASFDYTNEKNLDNQIGSEVQKGVYFEGKQDPDATVEELKERVLKNLQKDQLYYKKNAMFGIEGLGLEEMASNEVSGKHKESGYSDKLKELVKESLGSTLDTPSTLGESEEVSEKEAEKPAPSKPKKMKKESIDIQLAEIGKEAEAVKLEAQLNFLHDHIAEKQGRVDSINEDENLSELIDKSKLKEMNKYIKELSKKAVKMEKIYEKSCGKAYSRQEEIVGEEEIPSFE